MLISSVLHGVSPVVVIHEILYSSLLTNILGLALKNSSLKLIVGYGNSRDTAPLPALPVVTRAALQDIKFKDILIPKGMNIWVPVATLQQHPDIWGPDAHEFNPDRFAQGVIGACKIPQAFIPFGLAARICVGQHLAMTQLKLILSLTLSKFCLSLSPTYQHSPAYGVLLGPQHGIPLHVKSVNDF
ncbi:hypothetical protein SO802_008993 [Lithocarpus litseifolius]|uniref:Cytochrome P450 n=1 Tax=Lithocarpus litseifolius TaxID=425828 RepID=A0AAW2DFS0_9ROSI